jgi:tetratricopeptide (TPR) repeat protein
LNPDYERTIIGNLDEVPVLTVKDSADETVAVFHLEGQSWIAGRDTSCSLFIDNARISRLQFEIQRQDKTFMIKDLGSANGTIVNGTVIAANEWTHLQSGDEIKIVDLKCFFELRDPRFQEKFLSVPEEVKRSTPKYIPSNLPEVYEDSPEPEEQPPEYMPSQQTGFQSQVQYQLGAGTGVFQNPYPQAIRPPPKKSNFVRLLIILVLLGGGLFWLLDNPQKKKAAPQVRRVESPFDKLTPQQQQYVRDSYRLAENLFKQGRYELARQEITKVHQLVPYFEESKNIEQLAGVAIETEIEGKRAEERERHAQEIEEKIQAVASQCRKLLNPNVTMPEMENCLGPAVALSPDHPLFVALRGEVDQFVTGKAIRMEQAEAYQDKVALLRSIYFRAEKVEQGGERLQAIDAYEKVLVSKLPDPQDLKGKAKRQIASIRNSLSSQQTELLQKSTEAQSRGDLKAAFNALKEAVKIDPSNQTIKSKMNSIISELRKQMQPLYQEGILEESVGEVDTAKSKWKKIIEISIPEEEYFKKASIKLKKYGIEVKD